MKKISFKKEEYEFEEIELKYLFPYVYRYDNSNNTSLLESKKTILSNDLLVKFREIIYSALQNLIDECYEEPPIKMRQKHSTFFEKFIFDNKKYVVNYTTSELGRLMYTLYIRLSFIERAIESNSTITLT